MGLDLKLLPFDGDFNDYSFSHTILNCFRMGELFDAIKTLENRLGRPVGENFSSYFGKQAENEAYSFSETHITPYGEELKFVLVGDLLAFKTHAQVQENWKNRAIWAYLAQLPLTNKVALYWA